MRNFKKIILIVGAVGALGACSDAALEEYNDSPKLNNVDTAAVRLSFPDGFTSVAAKCFGTDMVYAAKNDNGRAMAVSSNHPWCEDGLLTKEEQNK
jgi:hypothetical protein